MGRARTTSSPRRSIFLFSTQKGSSLLFSSTFQSRRHSSISLIGSSTVASSTKATIRSITPSLSPSLTQVSLSLSPSPRHFLFFSTTRPLSPSLSFTLSLHLSMCKLIAAGFLTPLEHVVLGLVGRIPLLGSFIMGHGSVSLVYGYILGFDFLRCMMYSNVEIFPGWIFQRLPLLRYLIATPTQVSE